MVDEGNREKGTPGAGLAVPGAVNRGTEGSQHRGVGRGVVFVIFMTMEELRVAGPLALRPWLERRMRYLKRGPGTIVEFHQDARRSDARRSIEELT